MKNKKGKGWGAIQYLKMKLKDDFITQDVDDTQFLVAVGNEKFNGMIRSNKTAAFIVDCLKEETSENEIIDKMCDKYDASRGVIEADVKEILTKLKSINAIEEKGDA